MPATTSIVRLLAGVLLALLLAASASAEASRPLRVEPAAASRGTVIEGAIRGDESVDYVVGVGAGQILSVDLLTSNASASFNILPPGSAEAIFMGSTSGGVAYVPVAGDYVIQVYLMRNAARRHETARYSLAIGVGGPDVADSLAGGPDYWQVAGVGGGDALNVRAGPATRYEVVGKARNGEVLEGRGCRMSGAERWCAIRATGSGQQGWVAGRFLVEAAAPPVPENEPGGPVGEGARFDATGSLPCAWAAGQPFRPCPFSVVRAGPGNAGVWIALGDGQERHILFEGGLPVAASIQGALSFEKVGDLFLLRVGAERYEIPEAVVNGG